MDSLTPQQRENFARTNEKLGLKADEYTFDNDHLQNLFDKKKELVFSADPIESDIPCKLLVIESIADYKRLLGKPDGAEEDKIDYPPPLTSDIQHQFANAYSKADFLAQLDTEKKGHIRKAFSAYVMGDASKVADYEPLLNSLMFPDTIAVASGSDINIPDGGTYTISTAGVHNVGTITVGKGAQLKVTATSAVTINVQQLIQM